MFRIHLVCEGPTDKVVLEAILTNYLDDFIVTQIQPEESLYGGAQGGLGGGWKGVCRWCMEARDAGGLHDSGVMLIPDLLIIHIDAEVADEKELLCAQPCPPPSDTVDELKEAVLGWLGEKSIPPDLLICIPSKSTEAWVIACLHSGDPQIRRLKINLECLNKPETLLISRQEGLVRRKQKSIRKMTAAYRQVKPRLATGWSRAKRKCQEASRFAGELKQAIKG